MSNIFFNANHSPIGAFSDFTLGFKRSSGGFGIELGKPANQDVYVGLESNSGEYYELLPFFTKSEDESKHYDIQNKSLDNNQSMLVPFKDNEISRDFKLGSDTWTAGDLSFTIYSPVCSIPEPGYAEEEELKKVINPAVYIDVTVDNTKGNKKRRAVLGFCSKDLSIKTHMIRYFIYFREDINLEELQVYCGYKNK